MHIKLSTSLDFFTADESFSLNELLLRPKNLFGSHAFCVVLHAFSAEPRVALTFEITGVTNSFPIFDIAK